ncbi:CMP-sialic acid transporter 3-like protein, partial [Tanacetum coccineum]
MNHQLSLPKKLPCRRYALRKIAQGAFQPGAPNWGRRPAALRALSQRLNTILSKYSSIVATIFTGFAYAAMFGHTLTINFMLGISVVFISMHQFFTPLSKIKEEEDGVLELEPIPNNE